MVSRVQERAQQIVFTAGGLVTNQRIFRHEHQCGCDHEQNDPSCPVGLAIMLVALALAEGAAAQRAEYLKNPILAAGIAGHERSAQQPVAQHATPPVADQLCGRCWHGFRQHRTPGTECIEVIAGKGTTALYCPCTSFTTEHVHGDHCIHTYPDCGE